MPKSPSVNFESIRKKVEMRDIKNDMRNKISMILVVMYSFLSLLLLIYTRPSFICRDSYNKNEYDKISYAKLFMYYILIQIPLFFYLFFSC
jgi:hypothetical protein